MNHPTSPYLSEIKTLRDRVEELEAETAYWKGQVLPSDADVRAIKAAYPTLSPQEVGLLVALSGGRMLTDGFLATFIDTTSLDIRTLLFVLTCRIRSKLSLRFKRHRNMGWQLEGESLAAVRNAMHRKEAA